ncbi:MAG: hypothetical protein FWG99_02340 [Treponema sp.]|nr:hypothetical protein [Treponema sp.]
MKTIITGKVVFGMFLTCFLSLPLLHGQNARNTPINVNLIIDGSQAFSGLVDEAADWVSRTLVDQLLTAGDRVTIWSAGPTARIVYSESVRNDADKEAIKRTLRDFSASGGSADFSGALRDAASRTPGSGISYTLLISSSTSALSSTLQGPQANLMRFSRVEEFRGWRALVVGLNLDARVRNAAAAFM